MARPIRRLLIANRGEIALRVIRACRESGIAPVAVYSEADAAAPHVAAADEAHLLGPAPARESYLRIDRILEAARKSRADAIHPGYGFLSENPAFARACAKARIRFVGPPADAMLRLGNKIEGRRLAQKAGVPVVPGMTLAVGESDDLRPLVRSVGLPLCVKAASGGGGKGMRVVRAAADLPRALREARSEAASAFGDPTVYLEHYVERPHHVEIQILADAHGHVVWLGERECSIQRRHQKLIEETPSPVVGPDLRRAMGEAACRLARAAGYVNAGTVEFLVDARGRFFFLEVNARLQVEHPVTEMATGIDLVREQFRIAEGAELSSRQEDVVPRGVSIECRICAEDAEKGFLPSTGTIRGLRLPAGPFTRADCGVEAGSEVSLFYDSMLAKVIVWGSDRETAIRRMARALEDLAVVGVRTTQPLLQRVLADRRFRAGKIHTRWLEDDFLRGGAVPAADPADESLAILLAAAIERQRRDETAPRFLPPRSISTWRRAVLDSSMVRDAKNGNGF